MGEDVVKQRRSGKEEGKAYQNVEGAPRGHVQDRQERPKEEQAGAQVLHEDHQDHGQAPDGEQGGQIAKGRQGNAQHPPRAHREHLPDVDQIGGEEDHQEDLAELGRLEAYRPQDDPQTGAVDLPPQAGGQQEKEDTGDADEVAVLAQPLQPAHEHQGEEERRQTHDQPDGLLACELLVEAEDHQDAQGRQQSRDGQEIGIRVGDQHSPPDMGDGEERQEHPAVEERRPGEHGGLCRVDESEPQSRQDQGRDEEEQFAVAGLHCTALKERR